jgi:hypothetical protein
MTGRVRTEFRAFGGTEDREDPQVVAERTARTRELYARERAAAVEEGTPCEFVVDDGVALRRYGPGADRPQAAAFTVTGTERDVRGEWDVHVVDTFGRPHTIGAAGLVRARREW